MKKIVLLNLTIMLLASCAKDKFNPFEETPGYSFSRNGESTVSYTGQKQRLNMLEAMDEYMERVNNIEGKVEAAKLTDMFRNRNNAFNDTTITKNLFSKCYSEDTAYFSSLMAEMDSVSHLRQFASEGVAGFLSDTYPLEGNTSSAGYLVDENGIEYKQLITKGLMGAVFFYQAMEVYFGVDHMNRHGIDNVVPEGSKTYTAMEHHYDEAFGYFGVAPDFTDLDIDKTDKNRARFWGEYCVERYLDDDDFGMPGINSLIMVSFYNGRKAIVDKNYDKRDKAIQSIANQWEAIIGNTAGNYLTKALSKGNPPQYKKHHYLSEAIAFMMCLKYHFENGNSVAIRSSNAAMMDSALAIIGPETNLWSITDQEINETINILKSAFNGSIG